MGVLYARVGGKWEAVGSSTTDRWNTAWGVVAVGSFSGNPTVTPTPAQVGSTITFASTVGRRYRATFFVRAVDNSVSTAGWVAAQLQIDSATYGDMLSYLAPGSGTHYNVINDQWSFNGTGLASSYRVNCRSSTNCTLYLENTLSAWYIEDVGPVTGAVAIPNPTPAWLPLTLSNGWTVANSQTPMYRLLGDMVQLRGNITGGSSGNNGSTMPVGYRPSQYVELVAYAYNAGWAYTTLTIQPDGVMKYITPSGAGATPSNISLWNIQYPVA